jgi:hypothetical protein
VLLGIVSWKNASEQPLLFACLLAGMAASILGMLLRWISHRMQQKEEQEREAGAARRPESAQPARRETGI